MDLKDKVALVTGGGTGLGREISLTLANAGMKVIINYSRSVTDAENTAEEIRALGGDACIVQADISRADEVEAMTRQALERFGRLDVLIANAGTTVFRPFEDLSNVTEDEWDSIMAVNVKGIWLCAKYLAPYLREQEGGRIVTISSIAGLRPSGSSLPYSVSKAAAIHLTKGLAKALGPEILVNSVAPGLIDTRWTQGHSQSTVENFMENAILQRLPTLKDCARQVLALCETDSVTGTCVVVDSGMSV